MNRAVRRNYGLVLAASLLMLVGTGVFASAQTAHAALYSPVSANSDELPEDQFTVDDALFAFTSPDLLGGDICIVADAPLSENDADNTCDKRQIWGNKSFILGEGTTYSLIASPPLRPGTWRLMTEDPEGDNGSGGGNASLSEPFTVARCQPHAGCDPRIGQASAAAFKSGAEQLEVGTSKTCAVTDLLGIALAASEGYDIGDAFGVPWLGAAISVDADAVGIDYSSAASALVGFSKDDLSIVSFSPSNDGGAVPVAKHIACGLEEMYANIVADPPDPDFGSVSAPKFSTLPRFPDPSLEALARSLDRQRSLSQAALVAYERYQGALLADNVPGQVRQAAAIASYGEDLAKELSVSAFAADAYSTQIADNPALNQPLYADADEEAINKAVRKRVRDSGFTAAEAEQLHSLGFDQPDKLANARDSLSEDDADVAVGTTMPDLLTQAATDMRAQRSAIDAFANAAAIAADQDVTVAPNSPPQASFVSNAPDPQNPRQVSFDGTASTDSDGTIAGYVWNFGDGSTATGVTTTHTYARSGNYHVTLTVTDNAGASDTRGADVVVHRLSPAASIAVQVAANPPLSAHFDGTGSHADGGSIARYEWQFGDGASGHGAQVDHTYAQPGTYQVVLAVTDDAGLTATAQDSVTVTAAQPPNSPPTAGIQVSGDTVAPAGLTFDGSGSADKDGTVTSYTWTFGDGTTASGQVVQHGYQQPGTYPVTLSVTDNDGATAMSSTSVVITSPSEPAAMCDGRAATIVGQGEAVIEGTRKDDVIVATAANEEIHGGGGDDLICAGDGDDYVFGDAGKDVIFGGTGADILDGGAGDDTLHGSAGDDHLDGGAGKDDLNGDDGNDVLLGGPDRDLLFGGTGDDDISGGAQADVLYGQDGSDDLKGNDGDDILHGGPGIDQLDGGAGRNVLDQD